MDVNFKLIATLGASLLVLALLVDAWFRERRAPVETEASEEKNVEDEQGPAEEDLEACYDSLKYDSYETELSRGGSAAKWVDRQHAIPNHAKDEFLIVHVIAKHGNYFPPYELLQAISATGMQFGAMNIFHYVEDAPKGKLTLFSLASSAEPGEFDLNNIGSMKCGGLAIFMNITRVPDPGDVFVLMLETAEQLAEDLEGELRAAPNIPWSQDIFHHYENKILNIHNSF